jgi:hypothetical protein
MGYKPSPRPTFDAPTAGSTIGDAIFGVALEH